MNSFYRNPVIPLLVGFFLLALGVKNYLILPISLYPNTSKPSFAVTVEYDSMTMESFRNRYGKAIESALSGLQGVELVEGSYRENRSRWEVTFSWDREEKDAKAEVVSVLDSFSKNFPVSWRDYVHANSSESSNLYISLSSESYSTQELHKILKEHFLGELNGIQGVDSAFFWLPKQEHIRIELKPEEILLRNINLHSLKRVISEKLFDKNLGDLKTLDRRYDVILPLGIENLESLKKIVVKNEGEFVTRLEDISRVTFVSRLHQRLMKVNGERSLLAGASMKTTGNITYVCQEFIKKMKGAEKVVGAPVSMKVILDPSRFIQSAVENLLWAILAGVLVATLMIFLFLGSLSQTLIISLSIPFSVLGGFSLMRVLGIEVNLISLGALALSVGMVVDGAIVVLENIMRHSLKEKARKRESLIRTIQKATSEVKIPLVASLTTTIVVFAPLSFTAPLANAILGDLARVMVCVLVISLFVTIYLIPPLTTLFLTEKSGHRSKGLYILPHFFHLVFEFLRKSYLRILDLFMRKISLSLGLGLFVILLLLSSFYILNSQVKRELLAEPASDKLWLHVNWVDGKKSLEEAEKYFEENIEPILESEYGSILQHYFEQVSGRWSSVLLTLKDKKDLPKLKKSLEEKFSHTASVRYHLEVWTPVAFKVPKEALFKIAALDSLSEQRRETLEELSDFFYQEKGVGHLDINPRPGQKNYYEIHLKEDQIARAEREGAPKLKESIQILIESYLEKGAFLRRFSIEEEEYPMRLYYPSEGYRSPLELKNLMVRVGDQYHPLRHFLSIEAKRKKKELFTKQGVPSYEMVVWAKESFKESLPVMRKRILNHLREHKKIRWESLSFHDPGAEINESLFSLVMAFFLSLTLILFVLVLQFETFRRAFLIMMAIPFGLIGVAFSLLLFKSTLSLNSMLGLILLSGTAVNNSILYMDFFLRSYKDRSLKGLKATLLETASLRFKPILMTTLTTIFGMLPVALALGDGGEVLQPLGIAVAGGLGVSTFLVLVCLPLVLFYVEKRRCA